MKINRGLFLGFLCLLFLNSDLQSSLVSNSDVYLLKFKFSLLNNIITTKHFLRQIGIAQEKIFYSPALLKEYNNRLKKLLHDDVIQWHLGRFVAITCFQNMPDDFKVYILKKLHEQFPQKTEQDVCNLFARDMADLIWMGDVANKEKYQTRYNEIVKRRKYKEDESFSFFNSFVALIQDYDQFYQDLRKASTIDSLQDFFYLCEFTKGLALEIFSKNECGENFSVWHLRTILADFFPQKLCILITRAKNNEQLFRQLLQKPENRLSRNVSDIFLRWELSAKKRVDFKKIMLLKKAQDLWGKVCENNDEIIGSEVIEFNALDALQKQECEALRQRVALGKEVMQQKQEMAEDSLREYSALENQIFKMIKSLQEEAFVQRVVCPNQAYAVLLKNVRAARVAYLAKEALHRVDRVLHADDIDFDSHESVQDFKQVQASNLFSCHEQDAQKRLEKIARRKSKSWWKNGLVQSKGRYVPGWHEVQAKTSQENADLTWLRVYDSVEYKAAHAGKSSDAKLLLVYGLKQYEAQHVQEMQNVDPKAIFSEKTLTAHQKID